MAEQKLAWFQLGAVFGVLVSIITFYAWLHKPRKAVDRRIPDNEISFAEATARKSPTRDSVQ